jgi:hypothetical protein
MMIVKTRITMMIVANQLMNSCLEYWAWMGWEQKWDMNLSQNMNGWNGGEDLIAVVYMILTVSNFAILTLLSWGCWIFIWKVKRSGILATGLVSNTCSFASPVKEMWMVGWILPVVLFPLFGQELQRAVFDMALPLAVFRSKTLQQMQRREEEYFEAGNAAVAVVGGGLMRFILCPWL